MSDDRGMLIWLTANDIMPDKRGPMNEWQKTDYRRHTTYEYDRLLFTVEN